MNTNRAPIGKPKADWSSRRQSATRGHTESHQLVQIGGDISSVEYHSVLRIIKGSDSSPRQGVVHMVDRDGHRQSFQVKEVKQGLAKYWIKVS